MRVSLWATVVQLSSTSTPPPAPPQATVDDTSISSSLATASEELHSIQSAWAHTPRCPTASHAEVVVKSAVVPVPLSVQRTLRDGVLSALVCSVHNTASSNSNSGTVTSTEDSTGALTVTYSDALPWFVRLWSSTAHAEIIPCGIAGNASAAPLRVPLFVVPGEERGRAGTVFAEVQLQPGEGLRVRVPVQLASLHLAEYPPDPNRYVRVLCVYSCCFFV
jgi:hypothetical protein